MKNFENALMDAVTEEVYERNLKASAEDTFVMTHDLYEESLRAMAQFAIKLAKEKSDD